MGHTQEVIEFWKAIGCFSKCNGSQGFKPNAYTSILNANASPSGGALEWLKEVHGRALEAGSSWICVWALPSSIQMRKVATLMMADYSTVAFNTMGKRDVVTWNTMIGGLGQHGCGPEALQLFRKMLS